MAIADDLPARCGAPFPQALSPARVVHSDLRPPPATPCTARALPQGGFHDGAGDGSEDGDAFGREVIQVVLQASNSLHGVIDDQRVGECEAIGKVVAAAVSISCRCRFFPVKLQAQQGHEQARECRHIVVAAEPFGHRFDVLYGGLECRERGAGSGRAKEEQGRLLLLPLPLLLTLRFRRRRIRRHRVRTAALRAE